ncbi:MAG: hypothetical protein AOA65_1325 [Candidatus Bathyarchaeota archaeon BA1]|nr:MAG: hypothetical protein AOA65_1325 [Candidatus Bathyarchaeota archaeon BA1]
MDKGYSTHKALVLILLFSLLGSCSAVILHWKYGGESLEQQTFEGHLMLETDKKVYHLGEPVQIKVFLINEKSEKVELRSLSYDLTIYRFEQSVYTTKVRVEFLQPIMIEPVSTYQIPTTYTWHQKDIKLNLQVPTGAYTIKVSIPHYNLTATTSIIITQ